VTKRRVGVFTSARSDLMPLTPVIRALDQSPRVNLTVVAGFGHLDERRGRTLQDIDVAAPQLVVVGHQLADATAPTLTIELGAIASGIGSALDDRGIDTLVVLGDRWELMAAVSAALLRGTALVHLHGGEITLGALDDRVRHAVTKLADLHCCASEDSAQRILQLGEEPERVVVTGAPGLDAHLGWTRPAERDLAHALGIELERPFGLLTYHPETIDRADVGHRARLVIDTAATSLATVVVTYPGVDTGADDVMAEIERATERHRNLHVVPHLGDRFGMVLAAADVMVGNSSSGIWEAATFELPVVDIGDRQGGRLRPANVVHVGYDEEAMRAALRRAVDPAFRAALQGMANPYGDGRSADRVLDAILALPSDRPLPKRFVDHDGG
jgi:UDP-N-acetylglucosamine 2-epimerase (non-hydrolysing)